MKMRKSKTTTNKEGGHAGVRYRPLSLIEESDSGGDDSDDEGSIEINSNIRKHIGKNGKYIYEKSKMCQNYP